MFIIQIPTHHSQSVRSSSLTLDLLKWSLWFWSLGICIKKKKATQASKISRLEKKMMANGRWGGGIRAKS